MVYGTTFLEAYGQELLPSVISEDNIKNGIDYDQMMDIYYECWYGTEYICSLNESVMMLNEAHGYTSVNEGRVSAFLKTVGAKFKKFIEAVKNFFGKLIQKIKEWFAHMREKANERRDKRNTKLVEKAVDFSVVQEAMANGKLKFKAEMKFPAGDVNKTIDKLCSPEGWADIVKAVNNTGFNSIEKYTKADVLKGNSLEQVIANYNTAMRNIGDVEKYVSAAFQAVSKARGGDNSTNRRFMNSIGLTPFVTAGSQDNKITAAQYKAICDYMTQSGATENRARKAVETTASQTVKDLQSTLKDLESASITTSNGAFGEQLKNYQARMTTKASMVLAKFNMRAANEFAIPMIQRYYSVCTSVFDYIQRKCPAPASK